MANSRVAFVAADGEPAREALAALTRRYGQRTPEEADVIVALGGDGFMLEAIHSFMHLKAPIFGMHRGTVGFLMNRYDEAGLPERLAKATEVLLHPLRMTARTAANGTPALAHARATPALSMSTATPSRDARDAESYLPKPIDPAQSLRSVIGSKEIAIKFPKPESDNEYMVVLQLSWLTNQAIVNRTPEGFTAQFATPPTGKGELSWLLVR